jgi:hypothetical protein
MNKNSNSEAFNQYRKMEIELRKLREQKKDEEDIIERMAEVWWNMSEKERSILNSEGSTCFPGNQMKTIQPILQMIQQLYSRCPVGCCLHIVLDDNNVRDYDLDFCIQEAKYNNHKECEQLAVILRDLSEEERVNIINQWENIT